MRMHQKYQGALTFLLSLLFWFLPASDRGIPDAESLIEAMYKKYDGKWYQTLTFEQQTIRYDTAGNVTKEELWYEALRMPDKLSIKIQDWDSGNGMMIRNDSLYRFKEGTIAGTRPMLHPLLILGFSVYNQPVEKTINDLKVLGIDFSKFHKRTFEGEKVYVVGAEEGDETSTQFWVRKNGLLFVRLIQNFGEGRTQDIRFNKYQPLGGGWIAPEVLFYANGKLRLKEVYTNIRTPELSKEVFEPGHFQTIRWKP